MTISTNIVRFWLILLVAVFALFLSCDAFGVDLFANKHFRGRSTTIEVKQGCVDVPREWDDEISSIQPSECIIIYKHPRCLGPRVRLEPWSFGTAHLEEINFEDKLSSISSCSLQNSGIRERDEY